MVKLVPIAHGSTAEKAYSIQEIPHDPLDEVLRTIWIFQ